MTTMILKSFLYQPQSLLWIFHAREPFSAYRDLPINHHSKLRYSIHHLLASPGCNHLTLSNQLGEGCAPYARFSLHTSTDIHRLVHVLPAFLLYCSSTCRIGSLGFTKYPIHQQIPYPHSNLQISKVTTPLSSHFIFSLSMAGDRIPRTVGLGAA